MNAVLPETTRVIQWRRLRVRRHRQSARAETRIRFAPVHNNTLRRKYRILRYKRVSLSLILLLSAFDAMI